MSGRSPEQLAREVRDVMHSSVRDPAVDRALAALAELQAQAEAGQLWRDALAEDRGAVITAVYTADETTLERITEAAQLIDAECQDAAAAPSPADQEPYDYSRVEGREGIVTVYDHEGRYLGCMGVETWNGMLAREPAS